MKKTTVIQFTFDTEKYSALLRYAVKKDISVETELVDTIDKLYKKLVPSDVREFIEEALESEEAVKKLKSKKAPEVSGEKKDKKTSSSSGCVGTVGLYSE